MDGLDQLTSGDQRGIRNLGVIRVTPELAVKWLANQQRNRRISDGQVNRFSQILKDSQWKLDPTGPLTFDTHGRLRNGQHRLTAITKTGISAEFWVYDNYPDDELSTMDTGRHRTNSDILQIETGDTHARAKTSVTTLAAQIALGRNSQMSYPILRIYARGLGEEHLDAVCPVRLPQHWLLALVYFRPVVGDELIEELMTKLVTNDAAVEHRDPHVARARTQVLGAMINFIASTRGKRESRAACTMAAMRAVQAYHLGESLLQIRVGSTTGYEWANARRLELGLPTLGSLMPTSLRPTPRTPRKSPKVLRTEAAANWISKNVEIPASL